MNFLAAVKTANFAERAFAAAGLDLSAMLKAEDDTALAAHLESVKAGAAQTAPKIALTADHPEVAALIKTAVEARAAELHAAAEPYRVQATVLAAGLGALGIVAKASDEAKGLQAADVTTALKAHASKEARALLAAKGFGSVALDAAPNPDPTKPPAPDAPKLTGRARTEAAFKAQTAARAL
jgi:hypothetical protein